MRALTWQGNLDVRVTDVPDPRIQEPSGSAAGSIVPNGPGGPLLPPRLASHIALFFLGSVPRIGGRGLGGAVPWTLPL